MNDAWPPRHPIVPSAIGIAQPQAKAETHSQSTNNINTSVNE